MDSQRVKRLEQILARRRQVLVSVAEMESAIKEEEHVAPVVELMSPPLEAMAQASLEKVLIDGVPTKTAPKMSTEGCSKKDSTR